MYSISFSSLNVFLITTSKYVLNPMLSLINAYFNYVFPLVFGPHVLTDLHVSIACIMHGILGNTETVAFLTLLFLNGMFML